VDGDFVDLAARRRRLRWRCRRGLLENDLLLTRFLDRFEENLSEEMIYGLDQLLDLSDNALLDLVLARRQPEGELQDLRVVAALDALRSI